MTPPSKMIPASMMSDIGKKADQIAYFSLNLSDRLDRVTVDTPGKLERASLLLDECLGLIDDAFPFPAQGGVTRMGGDGEAGSEPKA